MKHTIKAQDVKPGMEIEWKFGGYYTRCVVGLVQKENLSYPAYSIRAVGSAAGWKTFSAGHEVTVLKEAQPPEPTAFGACVKVEGVKYVRIDHREYSSLDYQPWMDSFEGSYSHWNQLTSLGTVHVINADPFATPARDDAEPRVWERWEDVPDETKVDLANSNGEYVYRKVLDYIQFSPSCEHFRDSDNLWMPSSLTADYMYLCAPFTEVL